MLKQVESKSREQLDLPLGVGLRKQSSDPVGALEAFSVFDFSKPAEAYDLAHQICTRGQKLSDTFFWHSDVPIVVRLSTKFATFSRDNLQDVLRKGKIDFQGIQAEGTKNGGIVSRILMPVLERTTAGEYHRLRESGGLAELVSRHFSLKPTLDGDQDSYILNFSENSGDRLAYVAHLHKQRSSNVSSNSYHA